MRDASSLPPLGSFASRRLELKAWSFFRRSPSLTSRPMARSGESASTFIIVLWIAFGLVSITLYFAHAMSFELRASDNRVSGMAAEQAIEGAVRYVNYVLSNQPTNGFLPDPTTYLSEAVPVGE